MLGKNVLTVPKEDPLASSGRPEEDESILAEDPLSSSVHQTKDEFIKHNGWFIPSLHADKVCE